MKEPFFQIRASASLALHESFVVCPEVLKKKWLAQVNLIKNQIVLILKALYTQSPPWIFQNKVFKEWFVFIP